MVWFGGGRHPKERKTPIKQGLDTSLNGPKPKVTGLQLSNLTALKVGKHAPQKALSSLDKEMRGKSTVNTIPYLITKTSEKKYLLFYGKSSNKAHLSHSGNQNSILLGFEVHCMVLMWYILNRCWSKVKMSLFSPMLKCPPSRGGPSQAERGGTPPLGLGRIIASYNYAILCI
jgi:hypothetical protein